MQTNCMVQLIMARCPKDLSMAYWMVLRTQCSYWRRQDPMWSTMSNQTQQMRLKWLLACISYIRELLVHILHIMQLLTRLEIPLIWGLQVVLTTILPSEFLQWVKWPTRSTKQPKGSLKNNNGEGKERLTSIEPTGSPPDQIKSTHWSLILGTLSNLSTKWTRWLRAEARKRLGTDGRGWVDCIAMEEHGYWVKGLRKTSLVASTKKCCVHWRRKDLCNRHDIDCFDLTLLIT